MYWKFIFVNFLLVLPNTWILTSASLENVPDAGLQGFGLEDSVLEAIAQEFSKHQGEEDIPQ
ncbi:unnamed protein product, partial [Candidula unifasciata]